MAAAPVLITGAAGFIGSHLTRRLARLGHSVHAVDVQPEAPTFASAGVHYNQVDIRETQRLAKLLSDIDTVYHLASVHLAVHESEAAFQDVNVKAADDLVAACAAAGVRRLVHTSSVGIYGHVEDPPATEDSPKHPQTPYERTKLSGEQAMLRRARELGLDIVVLRPAWVYGPGCPRTAKLFRTLRKKRFFYIGDGSNLRHPIYIEEMLDAFERAARASSDVSGQAFIVGGPRYMTLREMIEAFARALDVRPPRLSIPAPIGRGLGFAAELAFSPLKREPPFSRRSLAFFENDNAFDTTAAQQILGFQPRIELEEGLRLTLAENGSRLAD